MASSEPFERRPLQSNLKDFNKWLIQNKNHGLFIHSSLALIYNPRWQWGFGAHFAGKSLTPGTVVARTSKQCMLSVRTVSSKALQEAIQAEELTGVEGLTIAYIYESCKGKQSFFYGYLSTFTLPDVPMLWKDEEKLLLKGTEIESYGLLEMVSHLVFLN